MRRVVFVLIALVLVALALGGGWIWDAYLSVPAPSASEVVIEVEPGSSIKTISVKLDDAGLLPSRFFFERYVAMAGADRRIQAGRFVFKPGMSYRVLLKALTNAEAQEVEVTLLEGWTAKQMGEYVAAKNLATQSEWNAAIKENWSVVEYPALVSKPDGVDVEGYLFPDTYRVYKNATAAAIVRLMLQEFEDKLTPEMRSEIDRRGRTVHQIVTMASIVEREVRTDADRAKVADLFWRRLAAGMPLQADSTIHYVTGTDDVYTSAAERQIASPYNTYKYPGLPPGPISSPGLASLRAAISPEPNDAWYFLTDAEGRVHYARTNDEHNANRAKYLR